MKKLLVLSLLGLSSPILFADIEDEFVMIEDGQLEDEFVMIAPLIAHEETTQASNQANWNFELANQSGTDVKVQIFEIEGDSDDYYRSLINSHLKNPAYSVNAPVFATQLGKQKVVRLDLNRASYVVRLQKKVDTTISDDLIDTAFSDLLTKDELEQYLQKRSTSTYYVVSLKSNTGYFTITPQLQLEALAANKKPATASGLPLKNNIRQNQVKKIDVVEYIDFQ